VKEMDVRNREAFQRCEIVKVERVTLLEVNRLVEEHGSITVTQMLLEAHWRSQSQIVDFDCSTP